jgi:hypothetical protein
MTLALGATLNRAAAQTPDRMSSLVSGRAIFRSDGAHTLHSGRITSTPASKPWYNYLVRLGTPTLLLKRFGLDTDSRASQRHHAQPASDPRSSSGSLCHGGFGTLMGAVESGVPLVIVPLGADQLHNAERARQIGIATVVDPAQATPEVLRNAIASVLASDDSHRNAVQALRAEAKAMPSMADAVYRLVAMAKT